MTTVASRLVKYFRVLTFVGFALVLVNIPILIIWKCWLDIESWWAKALVMVWMTMSIPAMLWIGLGKVRFSWLRVPLKFLLAAAMPLIFIIALAPAVRYASWSVVAELQLNDARYRAYVRPFQLYGEAIELRREKRLVLGLMVVSGPHRAAEADRADLRQLENGKVEAKVYGYNGKEWTYVFPN